MNLKTINKALRLNLYLTDFRSKVKYVTSAKRYHQLSPSQPVSPNGYQTNYMINGVPQIVSYSTLIHLLATNFDWNAGIIHYFSAHLNSYHTSHKQLRLDYRCYKSLAFNYLCSKHALQFLQNINGQMWRKIAPLISNHNLMWKRYRELQSLYFLYAGNYQFKLLTTDDTVIAIHDLLRLLHNIPQLCIVTLLFNFSDQHLAKMSHISKSTITQLREPYSQNWQKAYNSLTYRDAKHLYYIYKQYHDSQLNFDYKIPSVVNYHHIYNIELPKFLSENKQCFRDNRKSSLKDDELNG